MSTTVPHTPRRCGDRGWLVDVTDGTPGDWAHTVSNQHWARELLEDVVPSDTSVLVIARPGAHMDDVCQRLLAVTTTGVAPPRLPPKGPSRSGSRTLTIPVRYRGRDLSEVGHCLGLTTRQVVDLHANATYTVGFFGFAPGFAYLRGLDERLHLRRRAEPRTHVDAGAVAIAGRYTVIYPGHTPGGWHIIGSTTETLWNLAADPPNRLNVGDVVRFKDIT